MTVEFIISLLGEEKMKKGRFLFFSKWKDLRKIRLRTKSLIPLNRILGIF